MKSEEEFLTDLSYYPGINRALIIKNPASILDLPKVLQIKTNNEFKTWNISQWGTKFVLLAEGTIDIEINPGVNYKLIKNQDEILSIEKRT